MSKKAQQHNSRSRVYGTITTIEGQRAVPKPSEHDDLTRQRATLVSRDCKAGKSRYDS